MQIGNAEKEFVQTACNNFLSPLKNFLEGDMRTITVSFLLISKMSTAKRNLRKTKEYLISFNKFCLSLFCF